MVSKSGFLGRAIVWLRHLLRRAHACLAVLVGMVGWAWGTVALGQGSDFRASFAVVPSSISGVDFVHTDGAGGDRYVVETVLGSLALFDYDGDGFIDIYFVNGAPLPAFQTIKEQGRSAAEAEAMRKGMPTNRLYRNLGDFRFVDVTEEAGLGDTGYGMGVVVGDVDEDGDPDLFISNFGSDRFYLNQGDGTFREATEASGFSLKERVGAGNALFDMDGDGDLDLYCASYIEFDYAQHRTRKISGKEFHTGPNDYSPAADVLYRNNGNGTFTDVSTEAGINAVRAPGMGVLAADFDDDGDVDVFVANDQHANYLWINDGGVFREDALIAGVAFDRNGKANGNMAIECADLNGDALLDFVTTTYQDEMPVYYEALDVALFTDTTNVARIDSSLYPHVKWGVGVADFDNDSDRDLFIACGHFLDNIQTIDDRTDVKVLNYLLANEGQGKFRNVSSEGGSALEVRESSRGAAIDDLDNDGDLDFVVLNVNAEATLARNELDVSTAPGINLRLVGTQSNRDAVGSKVQWLSAGGEVRSTQIVCAGRGYESHYGSRLHFALGDLAEQEVIVRVIWPSGKSGEFGMKVPAGGSEVVLVE